MLRRARLPLAPRLPLLGLIAFVVAVAGSCDVRAEPHLRAIRLGLAGEATRIVLESDAPLRADFSASSAPERLTIDLARVEFTLPASARPTGLVRQIYFGHSGPDTSRIIADIARPFRVEQVLRIPPEVGTGYRLVIDIQALPSIAPSPPPAQTAAAALLIAPSAPKPGRGLEPPAQAVAEAVAADATAREADRPMIVIDAGHGGHDPGAIGRTRETYEKDVTLKAARILADKLRATGRYRVTMTRDDDTFIPLRERLHKARAVRGDLFVSLHADSLEDRPEHGGATVYTLSQRASDAESQRIAAGENAADDLADSSYQQYDSDVVAALIDLAMRDSGVRSEKVATRMVDTLGDVTPMVERSLRSAGFVVLMSPDMPSVLIEMGYLSNARDERRLRSEAHLERLASALVRAIDHARDANLLLTH
ncbi:N-acetylmuramoyl-L-alanine amidase [Marinivivus vitaminiproducens]|uniref:N-acetylmuramoyl-L-alanine amidase n=1 Tax=Marinivivus vitaminiproducens TaxID=3035935 RepID=UPI00279EC706|nr:N-acetylmuramoyl-L-alanine amidase [Geminicoccaceae bacterium SCSIO 64248]